MDNTDTPTIKVKKKRRERWTEAALRDDIKYRGPLSYRAFQIIGWLCIVASQVGIILSLAGRIRPELGEQLSALQTALQFFSTMSLPFLLMASFALMLDHSEGYTRQLMRYMAAMLGVALAFYLVYYYYGVGTLQLIGQSRQESQLFLNRVLSLSSRNGFFAFNIFVDMFLCALLMFLLNVRPKRVFTGRRVIIIRLLALVPIAYEIMCMSLKWNAAIGNITLPAAAYPFMTVKPPMTFAVFLYLALFLKRRERRFLKTGHTYDEYAAFLDTRRNSLQFSRHAAVALLLAGLIDMGLYILGTAIQIALTTNDVAVLERLESIDVVTMTAASAVGFGRAMPLIFMAPVVLLFSYTRTHSNKRVDTLIPVGGVALIILVYIQGTFQILQLLPLPKLNLEELYGALETLMSYIRGGA